MWSHTAYNEYENFISAYIVAVDVYQPNQESNADFHRSHQVIGKTR